MLRHTEVREIHGDAALAGLTVEETRAGERRDLDVGGLFIFIGADPCTEWLDGQLAKDDDGFLLTGGELDVTHLDVDPINGGRPSMPLETSLPGVFAVGDGRTGSIKRVASAVGEGSMSVRLVHQYLASQAALGRLLSAFALAVTVAEKCERSTDPGRRTTPGGWARGRLPCVASGGAAPSSWSVAGRRPPGLLPDDRFHHVGGDVGDFFFAQRAFEARHAAAAVGHLFFGAGLFLGFRHRRQVRAAVAAVAGGAVAGRAVFGEHFFAGFGVRRAAHGGFFAARFGFFGGAFFGRFFARFGFAAGFAPLAAPSSAPPDSPAWVVPSASSSVPSSEVIVPLSEKTQKFSPWEVAASELPPA